MPGVRRRHPTHCVHDGTGVDQEVLTHLGEPLEPLTGFRVAVRTAREKSGFKASRPICANAKNPALSMARKLLGTSGRGSDPARPVPAVAPRNPLRSADACRRALG